MSDEIFVKSHVARDLLQSAGLFKNDRLVVWEYVVNGLQYITPGTKPEVHVTLDGREKKISISDNGRGMDWQGLQNFFVMHGENIDRRQGQPGRGFFGTGKSAAFGIAELLRITTICGGRRSKVELCRADIVKMSSEAPIPVKRLEKEVPATEPNGTLVEIEGVHLRSLDQTGVRRYVERNIAKWRGATVWVNGHECEYNEPPIAEVKRFPAEGETTEILGDVELIIKVSKKPLEEELRGVSIFSNNVLYETTLAGSEGREMAHYIFGEIDVPKLSEDKSPIAPFDLGRSMKLNPENELVREIHAYIGRKVELVRRNLCEAERKRRAEDEMRKLEKHAAEIAKVINEDFDSFKKMVSRARARAGYGHDAHRSEAGGGLSDEELLLGNALPAEPLPPNDRVPNPEPNPVPPPPGPPDIQPPVLPASPDAEKIGDPAGGNNGKRKPRGGFSVRFEPMGPESDRAVFRAEERVIYVNIDHPQLVAARGPGTVEDPMFLRLSYEIAFSEYAVALAQLMVRNDNFIDLDEPLVVVRERLNSVARKGALLYS
jgi:hypothetical protein